jgi:hypothetical protein
VELLEQYSKKIQVNTWAVKINIPPQKAWMDNIDNIDKIYIESITYDNIKKTDQVNSGTYPTIHASEKPNISDFPSCPVNSVTSPSIHAFSEKSPVIHAYSTNYVTYHHIHAGEKSPCPVNSVTSPSIHAFSESIHAIHAFSESIHAYSTNSGTYPIIHAGEKSPCPVNSVTSPSIHASEKPNISASQGFLEMSSNVGLLTDKWAILNRMESNLSSNVGLLTDLDVSINCKPNNINKSYDNQGCMDLKTTGVSEKEKPASVISTCYEKPARTL